MKHFAKNYHQIEEFMKKKQSREQYLIYAIENRLLDNQYFN